MFTYNSLANSIMYALYYLEYKMCTREIFFKAIKSHNKIYTSC